MSLATAKPLTTYNDETYLHLVHKILCFLQRQKLPISEFPDHQNNAFLLGQLDVVGKYKMWPCIFAMCLVFCYMNRERPVPCSGSCVRLTK